MEKGLTIIELLIVIAVIAIIGATTTPFLSRFILQTNHSIMKDKIISTLRKAQAYAMDGKDNQVWGVCINSSNVRLYSGSCASPIIVENFTIPSTVTVTGLSDTTFNKRGEPSGSLIITVSSSIQTSSVQLNSAGGISVN